MTCKRDPLDEEKQDELDELVFISADAARWLTEAKMWAAQRKNDVGKIKMPRLKKLVS